MSKKVALVYRKKKPGRHSIERLFNPLDKLPGVNKVELPCDLNSLINAIKLFFFSLKIKEKKIHITGDVHYMAIFLFWKRTVITIHDCNHYESQTGFRKWLMGLLWYKIPIAFSEKIIVISPFVKVQLQKHFNVSEEKITIIPNSFQLMNKKSLGLSYKKFNILIIGTKENKNLIRLFIAIKDIENIHLQIVGKLNEKQEDSLKEYKISYSNSYNVCQDILEKFYQSSQMLYFASTKEGFGLPILEAQSCGVPVLTSSTTSMPYVAGDGALIVDPYSLNEIKEAIFNLKDNKDLRERVIKKGFNNIKRFDGNQFVVSYLSVYKAL